MSGFLDAKRAQALPCGQWPSIMCTKSNSMLMDTSITHRSVMICHLEIRYTNKGCRHSVVLTHMWSRMSMLHYDAAVGVGLVVTCTGWGFRV